LASSRGARQVILDYLHDMSAVLRSGLLALEPLTTVFRGAQKETHMNKKISYLAALLGVCLPLICLAQMMDPGMGGMGRQMGGGVVSPDLMAACSADLGSLGLSQEKIQELETKRFELQKSMIRAMADLKIAKLELQQMLENRLFDANTAEKKIEEISEKEKIIRLDHINFLKVLAENLTDEQWKDLKDQARKWRKRRMSEEMEDMPDMPGPGMRRMMRDEPPRGSMRMMDK